MKVEVSLEKDTSPLNRILRLDVSFDKGIHRLFHRRLEGERFAHDKNVEIIALQSDISRWLGDNFTSYVKQQIIDVLIVELPRLLEKWGEEITAPQ